MIEVVFSLNIIIDENIKMSWRCSNKISYEFSDYNTSAERV